jgi:hypothetical protein
MVSRIDFDIVKNYINYATINYPTCVSVGSGNGVIERKLQNYICYPYLHIICVDPNPESFKSFPDNKE